MNAEIFILCMKNDEENEIYYLPEELPSQDTNLIVAITKYMKYMN